jgi:hypothetical protein
MAEERQDGRSDEAQSRAEVRRRLVSIYELTESGLGIDEQLAERDVRLLPATTGRPRH